MMHDIHAKYGERPRESTAAAAPDSLHSAGDKVRIGPNKLSLVTPQAFRDIYGFPSKTKKLFTKSDFYDSGAEYPSFAWASKLYHRISLPSKKKPLFI